MFLLGCKFENVLLRSCGIENTIKCEFNIPGTKKINKIFDHQKEDEKTNIKQSRNIDYIFKAYYEIAQFSFTQYISEIVAIFKKLKSKKHQFDKCY